jgi:hypothetical protein
MGESCKFYRRHSLFHRIFFGLGIVFELATQSGCIAPASDLVSQDVGRDPLMDAELLEDASSLERDDRETSDGEEADGGESGTDVDDTDTIDDGSLVEDSSTDVDGGVLSDCGASQDASEWHFYNDSSQCLFTPSGRTCEIGSVCGAPDGTGFCVCESHNWYCVLAPDDLSCRASLPVECLSDADCAPGVCIWDHGCAGARGYCSYFECTEQPAPEVATYCGCDGVTFDALCPAEAYSHIGDCR